MLLDDSSDVYLDVIPELVVEIISTKDRVQAVNDKTMLWLAVDVLLDIYNFRMRFFAPLRMTDDGIRMTDARI